MNITVQDAKCTHCGSRLEIPKNSRGQVKCPFCDTTCVIQGLATNAEMAAKENINSGFPLFAPSSTLHSRLISVFSSSPNIPLDLFEEAEVIREEHYCMPAYCFDCSATAHFNYEKGVDRIETITIVKGGKSKNEERVHTEWFPASSTISDNHTVFAPGSKVLAKQFSELYSGFSPTHLIDYDDLEFPHDVVTYSFDFPQVSSYNEYVIPLVKDYLEERAEASVSQFNHRNITFSGSPSIQKEMKRVFLGMYNIVFSYKGEEYSVWMSGDGKKSYHERIPVDERRKKELEDKKKAMEAAVSAIPAPKNAKFMIATAASVVAFIFFIWLTYYIANNNPTDFSARRMYAFDFSSLFTNVGIYGLVASIVSIRIFSVKAKKMGDGYKKIVAGEIEPFENEIDALITQISKLINDFIENKKALRGIYSELTGYDNAFIADLLKPIMYEVIATDFGTRAFTYPSVIAEIKGLSKVEMNEIFYATPPMSVKECDNIAEAESIKAILLKAGVSVVIKKRHSFYRDDEFFDNSLKED